MSERRHSAIMFTDIVGYTALMGSDEDHAFEVLKKNREIHSRFIEQFNGTLIKEMGDGMLISFNLASEAVRCAIEIQKACKDQNIPLKIGIHEGEMVFEGDDVLGDGVNIASRLQEDAQEGCINISGSVYRDIKNKSIIKAEFFNEKRFKNVEEPIKVYKVHCESDENERFVPIINNQIKVRSKLTFPLLGIGVIIMLAVLFWYFKTQLPSKEIEKSIAVLPFETITKDSTSQYIADGVREAILNNLLKIKNLKVGSRTSSETYRNSNKRIPEIAGELNVATIMEGSAQKFGDQIRITVQLIDGKTDQHIWSENYDRAWGDIFKIYSEIAEEVSAALQIIITPEEQEQISSASTMDVTAYDYFLQAREEQWKFWVGGDTIALNKAEMLYNKVMKIDPEYAPNWVYKASIYYDRHSGTDDYFELNYLDSVLWFCDKAISLDPKYDHPYLLKGMVLHQRGDVDHAIKSYERALALNQNDEKVLFETLWRLGTIYLYKKEYIKGIQMIRKALQKARGEPQDYRHMLYRLGNAYLYIGAYEEAKSYYDEHITLGGWLQNLCALDLRQGNIKDYLECLSEYCPSNGCYNRRAFAYLQLKEFETSLRYYDDIKDSNRRSYITGYGPYIGYYLEGFVLMQMGRQKEGMELIEKELIGLDKCRTLNRPDNHDYHQAAIYASLGDKEKALKHLREFTEQVYFTDFLEILPISFAQYDILFENLWDNMEFQEIIKQDLVGKAVAVKQIREMEKRGELDL